MSAMGIRLQGQVFGIHFPLFLLRIPTIRW